MTDDRTQPDSGRATGHTHIIRYALELGLLWIDGDGRDKVREALDALDTLEAQLEAIGAGGVSGPLMGRASLSANAGEPRDLRQTLATTFRGLSDRAYCDYIEQMRRDVCLGWEYKTKHGKFGEAELKGHTKAGELLGRHKSFAEAANALEGSAAPLAAPPTAQAEGWVNVDERLPAKNTEVLICFAEAPLPSTGQYTGHAADPAGWCYPNESYLWPGESEKLPDGGAPTVTHWMPLPPLPTSAEGVEHG